jgi:hypothetical protein
VNATHRACAMKTLRDLRKCVTAASWGSSGLPANGNRQNHCRNIGASAIKGDVSVVNYGANPTTHAEVMGGDERGVYGEYPFAPM